MESDVHQTSVLLGLAEVKAPLRKLTQEEREKIVHICYRQLLEIENLETNNTFREEKLKCIGVVDSFYALQEVDFAITSGTCRLFRRNEVILQFDLTDVIIALPAPDFDSRVIIVSQTQSFGRTALVLQMQKQQIAETIINKVFPFSAQQVAAIPSNSRLRRGADTFGRVVGRVNNLLSSIGQGSQGVPSPSSSPVDSLNASEDEDDLNADSESEDSPDMTPHQESNVIPSPQNTPRFHFSKCSMTSQEAEIEHLIQSETSFVETLKRLIDFKLILPDVIEVMKTSHSDRLFLYVEELYWFHNELLNYLKLCNGNVKQVCSVFKENSDNFRYHVFYISNIPRADKVYNRFYEILKQNNPSLGEDLRKPRMRLNYYILTFESLAKSCSEARPIINQITDVLKAYLKEADTRLTTDSVKLCPFSLVDHGNLVISGELSLKKGESLTKRRYQVLLFDDLLVLTKGNPESSEYTTSFYLVHTELVHELRGVLIYLNTKLNKKSVLVIFKAKTIKLQQKWIQKLKTCIDNIKRKAKDESDPENPKLHDKGIEEFQLDPANDQTESYSEENNKFPPLTIQMAFPISLDSAVDQLSKDMNSNIVDIQESERHLIKNLDYLLSLNRPESYDLEDHLDDIKLLYEFHLRYLYPALPYKKECFDDHITRSILNKRNAFLEAHSKILCKAAILKYESTTQSINVVFNLAVCNFFKYMTYFLYLKLLTENTKQLTQIRTVIGIFKEVQGQIGQLLKQKYIPDMTIKEKPILIEGVLSVKESLAEYEQNMYVILTTEKTYLLTNLKVKFTIYACFKNADAKLGPPPGMTSFQIKFLIDKKIKKKYNFTATTIESKSKWVSSYNKVLPQDLQRKTLIRISGRLRPKSVSLSIPLQQGNMEILDTSSLDEPSASIRQRMSSVSIIESDL